MTQHFLIIENISNPEITDMLSEGAIAELNKINATHEKISVSGCLEAGFAFKLAVETECYDGYIILGAIIKEENSKDDYIYIETIRNINQIAIDYAAAFGFGILNTENHSKAKDLANVHKENKGGLAARSAIEMYKLSEYFIEKYADYQKDAIDENE